MRSQRHMLEVHGKTSNGNRGHVETAAVTGLAPTASALDLTPTGASAVRRIMFLTVPEGVDTGQLEYTLGVGADNAFKKGVWVPAALFDNIKYTKGINGTFSYRYLWEDVNYRQWFGVLDVTATA